MAQDRPLLSDQQAAADEAKAAVNARVEAMGAAPAMPLPQSTEVQQDYTRLDREESTTTGDYARAMWNQDGIINGALASLAENQAFVPDPKYTPFEANEWKDLSEGVWPDFHKELYNATSGSQARFIKSRLLQKQRELQQLGDLGVPGNAARIALGIISPENLAMGVVAGWAARGVRAAQTYGAVQTARKAASMEEKIVALKALSERVAALEAKRAGGAALATGITAGVTGNVAFEKVRQMVNFEDDDGLLLDAALMSLPLVAPLSYMGARHAGRAAIKARAEADALEALRKIHLQEQDFIRRVKESQDAIITADAQSRVRKAHEAAQAEYDDVQQAVQAVRDAHAYAQHLRDFYEGKIDADEVITLDHNHMVREGLLPPDEEIELGGPATRPTIRTDEPWRPTAEGLEVVEGELVDAGTGQPVSRPLRVQDTFVEELTEADWQAMTAGARPAEPVRGPGVEFDTTVPEVPQGPPGRPVQAPAEPSVLDNTRLIDSTADDLTAIGTVKQRWGRRRSYSGIQGVSEADVETPTHLWQLRLSQAIASVFGRRVTFYKADPGAALGFHVRSMPDRLFVNIRSIEPHLGTTGHEFLHSIRTHRPDLYEEFRVAMIPLLKDRVRRRSELKRRGYNATWDTVDEEMAADVFGDMWTHRELWEDLAQRDPTRFQRIATAFVEFLDRVLATLGVKFGPQTEMTPYIRDIEAARKLVADTIFKYDPRTKPGGMTKPRLADAADEAPTARQVEPEVEPADAVQAQDVPASAFNSGKASLLRWDYYALLNRSQTPEVRALAQAMVKDAIQNSDTKAQARTASEWVYHYRKVVAGGFHREARDAYIEAARKRNVRAWERQAFSGQFFEAVTRLTRGDTSVADEFADIMPELSRASAAQQKVYARMLEEAKAAGVKGADQVEARGDYANRIWPIQKILEAERVHGRPAVEALIAQAIRVPGIAPEDIPAKAAGFLKAVKKLAYSPSLQNIQLHAQDMGTLRSLLSAEGLNSKAIDDIVDVMFEAKALGEGDKGRVENLKFRFKLDEAASIQTEAGTLRISDLLENDARVLVDLYVANMGGHAAMAKHGIRSHADFQAAVLKAQDAAQEKGTDPSAIARETRYLNDLYKHITGAPMSTQDFSATARLAHATRAYTRSVVLNQLGITAAFEATHAMSLLGARAWWEHSSMMRHLWQTFRKGYVADGDLADDMAAMVGAGNDMAMAYARQHEMAEGWYDKGFSKFESGTNKLSHAMDIASGNAGLTSVTRQVAAKAAAQKLYRMALGGEISPAWKKRMVGWGIDAEQLPAVTRDLKQYTTADRGGRITGIDWETWQRANPDTYESFTLYLDRARRDAIQDHDVGEMMPFMHQTIGKLFGELRTFFLVAHAKNFLKNAYYHDAVTFQVWMFGFVGQQIAYMMQTAMNYGHDPAELEKRLEYDRVWKAAFSRMSAAGFMPFGIETLYSSLTGEQFFRPGSTANTDSRNFLKPPSLTLATQALGGVQEVGGAMLGPNVLTSREAKEAISAIPGSRLMGIRNIVDALTSTLPASQPQPTP